MVLRNIFNRILKIYVDHINQWDQGFLFELWKDKVNRLQ